MNTRIHKLVREQLSRLAVAAVLSLALFAFTDPAAAKGPVAATIAGPGIDRPIELVAEADHGAVARLMEQTGPWYGMGDLPQAIGKPPGELGPAHLLSWVNAGPPDKSAAERTIHQILYLGATDGPIIYTPAQGGLEGWGPGVTGWFAAPEGLRDTLAELGVPMAAMARDRAIAAGAGSPGETDGKLWTVGIAGVALVGVAAMFHGRRPAN